MEGTEYRPVEDGWRNGKRPCFVTVANDHFNEESLIVEVAFDEGEGCERPKARLPLVYAPGHVIVEWENGQKKEHVATEQDQRDAVALLGRLWPAWAAFCREGHTTEEMLGWFEDHADEAKSAVMDYRVKHSTSGFPNAYVKDPANAKPKKERVTKANALTRANAALKAVFGGGAAQKPSATDDSEIPF